MRRRRRNAGCARSVESLQAKLGAVIVDQRLALHIHAAIIMLLPPIGGDRRRVFAHPFMEGVPRGAPVLEAVQQRRIVVHGGETRPERFHGAPGQGKNEAEGLQSGSAG